MKVQARSMNRKVLIIEDDPGICEVLSYYLRRAETYDLTIRHSAEEGLELIRQGMPFDIILCDIMLPGMDGIDFCEQVRKRECIPVIFTSCLDDDETIIRALGMGGDDYLVKPYHGPVLLAHIEATLRRCERQGRARSMTFGGIELDGDTRRVLRDGKALSLSPIECNLLWYMAEHPNRLIPYDEFYDEVWKKPSLGDYRSLFVHIRNLRKKIEADPSSPSLIKTHPMGGYIFSA